jgi:hypothetical protein
MLLQGGTRQIRSEDTASSYAEAGASAIMNEVPGERAELRVDPMQGVRSTASRIRWKAVKGGGSANCGCRLGCFSQGRFVDGLVRTFVWFGYLCGGVEREVRFGEIEGPT